MGFGFCFWDGLVFGRVLGRLGRWLVFACSAVCFVGLNAVRFGVCWWFVLDDCSRWSWCWRVLVF